MKRIAAICCERLFPATIRIYGYVKNQDLDGFLQSHPV
jgi:hypothetical protein